MSKFFSGKPLQQHATRNSGLRSHDFIDTPSSDKAHRIMFCGVCLIGFALLWLLAQGAI